MKVFKDMASACIAKGIWPGTTADEGDAEPLRGFEVPHAVSHVHALAEFTASAFDRRTDNVCS